MHPVTIQMEKIGRTEIWKITIYNIKINTNFSDFLRFIAVIGLRRLRRKLAEEKTIFEILFISELKLGFDKLETADYEEKLHLI